MSIFTERDKDLPLLTQVYQLDRPKDGKPPLVNHPDLDQWLAGLNPTNPLQPAEIEERVKRLLPIIALAKSIMDSVCSAGVVREDDMLAINQIFRRYRLWRAYKWTVTSSGNIPIKSISRTGLVTTSTPIDWQIIKAIETALNNAPETPDYFRQCQQCKSVFIVEEKNQVYCSKRCSNRTRNKRFHDKAKAQQKTGAGE